MVRVDVYFYNVWIEIESEEEEGENPIKVHKN